MKNSMIQLFKKYKHSIAILYLPFYMVWFLWLEGRDNVAYHSISCPVDDWIPFNEYFILPYLLWFGYVAVVLIFLFFQTEHLEDFTRCIAVLILGMTTSLIIYTVWPNSQPLRPDPLPRDNILTRIVAGLYQGDTSTNVCPSLHVYNSLAIHTALVKSYYFKKKRGIQAASLLLCIFICLSTMFLKQHSFIDVVCAFLLFGVYYTLVYHTSLFTPKSTSDPSNN